MFNGNPDPQTKFQRKYHKSYGFNGRKRERILNLDLGYRFEDRARKTDED